MARWVKARILIVSAVFLLVGCSSFDWRRAGEDMVQNACDDASNCSVVCPDGTVTDPTFPRCEDPIIAEGRSSAP